MHKSSQAGNNTTLNPLSNSWSTHDQLHGSCLRRQRKSECVLDRHCRQQLIPRHFTIFPLSMVRCFSVQEYHVDGFRFDLASILTRAPSAWHPAEWLEAAKSTAPGPAVGTSPTAPHSQGAVIAEDGYMTDGSGTSTGTPITDPPVVQMIAEDPILRNTKLIAEAWDCDGLNQVRCSTLLHSGS
jgi:hypothetical protein